MGVEQPLINVATGGVPIRLEVKLDPLPRISGRVLDGAGKPVANAAVWVFLENYGCMEPRCHLPVRKVNTDRKSVV